MAPPGLRVIAGSFRGRRLVAPAGDEIRPTKGIVREAMFSALDARGLLSGAVVLDLCAGTGALGIEALSRGAARALFVERDARALEATRHNLETIDLGPRTRVVRGDVFAFVTGLPPLEAPFDLVFADPPYDVSTSEIEALVEALGAPGWLSPGAMISVERSARSAFAPPAGFRAVWERTFGDTLVTFAEATEPQAPLA